MDVGLPTHAIDRAFLSLERSRPDARWDTGGVAYLAGPPPGLADFRAYVASRLAGLPALTHRLDTSTRRPRWRPNPGFAVEQHVHEAVADRAGGLPGALDAALRAPLPDDTPWAIWLVHGHAPDAYAVCYRFRHVCQDGVAAALAFRTLLGAGEAAVRPLPARRGPGDLLRGAVLAAGLACRFAFDVRPVRGRREAVPFVPTGERLLLRARVPVGVLRRVGAAHGASPNDVHLAALCGALVAWSRQSGCALPEAAALLPVDGRRHDEEQTWGNRCFAVPVRLPLAGLAPRQRLELVAAATAKVKRGRRRRAIEDLVRFMPDGPTEWYMRRVTSPSVTALVATTVPLAERGDLGVARVTGAALLPLCLPGHLFGVGLAFFGEWAEASFVADRALPGAELLPGLWEGAVAELDSEGPADGPSPRPPAP
ncbi:wax ester/triacylglycerol synthase domain-containing protein [Streptomyces sp. NPDC047002]|uniref:wax ester/triacylglycerol synthase domain-containing protein n=1 Tax=Streptomyces sp. NPDC047002 TaxID=3155475 RepID=UPI0034572573